MADGIAYGEFNVDPFDRIHRVAGVFNVLELTKRRNSYRAVVKPAPNPLERYNDVQFRKHFRFTKNGFRYILSVIKDGLNNSDHMAMYSIFI